MAMFVNIKHPKYSTDTGVSQKPPFITHSVPMSLSNIYRFKIVYFAPIVTSTNNSTTIIFGIDSPGENSSYSVLKLTSYYSTLP